MAEETAPSGFRTCSCCLCWMLLWFDPVLHSGSYRVFRTDRGTHPIDNRTRIPEKHLI